MNPRCFILAVVSVLTLSMATNAIAEDEKWITFSMENRSMAGKKLVTNKVSGKSKRDQSTALARLPCWSAPKVRTKTSATALK